MTLLCGHMIPLPLGNPLSVSMQMFYRPIVNYQWLAQMSLLSYTNVHQESLDIGEEEKADV